MLTPSTKQAIAAANRTPIERTNGATPQPERDMGYNPLYDPEYLRVAFPPNEEPMAGALRLMTYLLMLMNPLRQFFKDRTDVLVNGDVFIYYDETDSRNAVASDVIVAFGVDVALLDEADSYFTWLVGKPPEFVMEIGSESTAKRDLEFKRRLYARLGIRNYWLFDPPDGSRYGFILKGLRLVDGEYEEIPMVEGPGDNIRGHSDALGLDLCWEDGVIRFYNPAAGEYILNYDEVAESLDRQRAARRSAERRADSAEAEVRRLRALLGE